MRCVSCLNAEASAELEQGPRGVRALVARAVEMDPVVWAFVEGSSGGPMRGEAVSPRTSSSWVMCSHIS